MSSLFSRECLLYSASFWDFVEQAMINLVAHLAASYTFHFMLAEFDDSLGPSAADAATEADPRHKTNRVYPG